MAKSSTRDAVVVSPSFDDMTLMYQRFLMILGILPVDIPKFAHLANRLLHAYCLAWSTIYWTMYAFFAVDEYRRKRLTTDTICETVLVVGVTLRYYLLARRRFEFARLLDESRALWKICNEDGRREVRKFEQKVRLVFLVLFGSSSFSNVTYSVSAVVMTINAAQHNHTETRYLPFKWYSEDGPNLWPGYKTIFAMQVILVQNACITTTGVDSAGPLLIMFGAGYFRSLADRLMNIVGNDDSEILACLRLHQRILKFCSRIEKITRSVFLVQLMCTVYNLSLIAYKLVGSDPDRLKYLPIAMGMLVQLFICQWASDRLIDESSAISTAAYCASFVWMRRRLGKHLVLIIARSQRPVQMTAAGVVNLSLEKFASMLTSAVSFFTVLRNFND